MMIAHWRTDSEIERQSDFCHNWQVMERTGTRAGERTMRITRFAVQAPLLFFAGWLFNFVYDVKFLAGFASGWMAHSWIGRLFM